jgi:hypothetical protein
MDSLKDCGDFRDRKFRNYFNNSINVVAAAYMDHNMLSFLKSGDITDKNLLRFYLSYSDLCKECTFMETEFIRILFNYKTKSISRERIARFEDIIKSKTGILVSMKEHLYFSLKLTINNKSLFNELVDIFLDQI